MDRLVDRYGRCKEVDVFIHLTEVGVQELRDTGFVVTHAGAADSNPRVVIPAHNGNKEDFASLKECSEEVIKKLYQARG